MKWSSYLTRFILLLILCVLGMTVLFFGLSSYFFNQTATAGHYEALENSLALEETLLRDYGAGKVSREDLRAALNPALNPDGNLYMLLDEDRRVLAYTDAAVPYFAGDTLDRIIAQVESEGTAVIRNLDKSKLLLVMGRKTADGFALAGRTMTVLSGAVFSFRSRLLVSMLMVLCCILLLSTFAARRVSRPARTITEAAGRLLDGEQVYIPEDLPGVEMREIARAFNYLCRTVAKAIRELRYEKDSIAMVLEGLSEGVLAIDEKGQVLQQNAAAHRLLGEETEARATIMAALGEAHAQSPWDGKMIQGERVLHYVIDFLPADATGKPGGTVALIRDITEEERLERTRHDYVANISHELRTPLASIRGLAEGLRDGMVTDEKDQKRYYNIIVDESKRLSRLVNDLLELSHLQSNPAAFETEKVDPNELIYDLHDRNGSLFTQAGLAFERSLPDDALPTIISNEDRLSQVLTIFLDNARKYTKPGGTVTLGAENAEGGVRFFVRDTGIGMDEETKRLAFERFHQAERGRSDKGSGLGLSIAREVMQKMGVEIRVESELGKGSEFSFVIPIGRA